MNPRSCLLLSLSLAACWPASAFAAEPAGKPNILLIVSDDQGYADAGFQGSKEIPTPNLDRLAAAGVRCSSGYVSHPFCSPTRAGLMTGRYQQSFGHYFNPVYDPLDEKEGLPLSERLVPQFLQDAGWTTAWIGKWHLGASPAHTPQRRGFAETFGFIGGGHRYLGWQPNARQYTLPIEHNGQAVEVAEHLTTRFGKQAASFIRGHTAKPWFLYLAFNAPHTPHEPTPDRAARFASMPVPRRGYAAQTSLLDDAIGEVTGALADSGQDKRTLVFFFSDNGGPTQSGAVNTPLRGGKGQVYEGGVRVPFLVSWPGVLPSGTEYAQPVISLDVCATAVALAGATPAAERPLDGVDLLPYLTGKKQGAPHERLFWRTGPGPKTASAVREGDWKLVQVGEQPGELYDLAADIGESKNLAADKPEVAARLGAALDAWKARLVPPVFPGSSAKNEDWGPGGANQRGNPAAGGKKPRKKAPPAKP